MPPFYVSKIRIIVGEIKFYMWGLALLINIEGLSSSLNAQEQKPSFTTKVSMVKPEQLPELTSLNEAQPETQKAFQYWEGHKTTDLTHIEFDLLLCSNGIEISRKESL